MTSYTRASFSSGRLRYCAGHFPVVTVGDNVYSGQGYRALVGHYYPRWVASGRFFPATGNHDYAEGIEAFDQYWRKTPSVKRLVFKVMPDHATRLAALKQRPTRRAPSPTPSRRCRPAP